MSRNITAEVDPKTMVAEVEIKEDVTLRLAAGQHVYTDDDIGCIIHIDCILRDQSETGIMFSNTVEF